MPARNRCFALKATPGARRVGTPMVLAIRAPSRIATSSALSVGTIRLRTTATAAPAAHRRMPAHVPFDLVATELAGRGSGTSPV